VPIETKEPTWKSSSVPIQIIDASRDFQPRQDELNDGVVSRYAAAMRRGDVFPPILVAKLGTRLCVIDGFHRLAANRQNGASHIASLVSPMSPRQATALAINANAKHPLPLNRKDKQRCFKLYVDAGLHLDPSGNVKSLRSIRRDLSDIAWPNTIAAWLTAHKIEAPMDDIEPYDRYSEDDEDSHELLATQKARYDEADMQTLQTVDENLECLTRSYHALNDTQARETMRNRLQALLSQLCEADRVPEPMSLEI
jgi:hypothetical protein